MPNAPDPNPTIVFRRSPAPDAARQLSDTLYAELRNIAGAYMARERGDHLLQPTALVNEAYVRLAGGSSSTPSTQRPAPDSPPAAAPMLPTDRTHFRALAAVAMRRVLVDHARARDAQKRSPGAAGGHRIELHDDALAGPRDNDDVLAVDEAVKKLATLSERQARLVELRFFAGYSVEDAAEILGVSRQTCEADWRMARAWLKRELAGAAPDADDAGDKPT